MSQRIETTTNVSADATRAREGEGEAASDEADNAQRPAEGAQETQDTPPAAPAEKNIMLRRTGGRDEPTGRKVPVDPENPEAGERDEMHYVPTYAKPVAPGKLNIGMSAAIIMPSVEQQREGWHEPRVGDIIRNFPDRYIRVQPKGGK